MFKKVLSITSAVILIASFCYSAENDVTAIVFEVEKILSLEDILSKQKMTVYRKDGSVRPYEMDVLTKGKDKTFAEILSPPREKGRQMLKLGDVVWSYLPSVKKSIRISGRGSFMGGDFENNDVLRLNLVGDYTAKILEELPDQYVLELKGKDLSLSYAKIKLWIRKVDYQAMKQEYYTLSDKLIKSTKYESIKDFHGHKRPAVLVMQSALSPKQKTILEILEIKRGVNNPSRKFRRSSLGK